jgi:hypothetical protein
LFEVLSENKMKKEILIKKDRSSLNFYNSIGFLGVSDILLLDEDYLNKLFDRDDCSP